MVEDINYELPKNFNFEPAKQDKIDFLQQTASSHQLKFILDNDEDSLVIKDLTELQNLLIIDTKSYGQIQFIHHLLFSLLTTKKPSELKLVLADSHKSQLNNYQALEKHFLAGLPGEENVILKEPYKVVQIIKALCTELGIRRGLFENANVENVKDYNNKFHSRKLDSSKGHQYFPHIVLVLVDIGPYNSFIRNLLFNPLQKLILEGPAAGLHCIIGFSQIYGDTLFNNMVRLIPAKVVFNLNTLNKYRIFFEKLTHKFQLDTCEFIYEENDETKKGTTLRFEPVEIENFCRTIALQEYTTTSLLLPEAIDDNFA